MKNIVITGLLAALMILNPLTFLAASAQVVNIGPATFVDSTLDVDWSNEAEFVYYLRQAADEDLRQMNDQVAQQLMDQVQHNDMMFRLVGGVGLVATGAGTAAVIFGLRQSGMLRRFMVIGGSGLILFLGAPSIVLAVHNELYRNRVVSAQELREIVGEQLAAKVTELQKVLHMVYRSLAYKDICLEIPNEVNPWITVPTPTPGDGDVGVVATLPKEWGYAPTSFTHTAQYTVIGSGQTCVALSNPGPVRQLILQQIFSAATAHLNMANTAAQNYMAPTSYDDLATTLASQTIVLPGHVILSETRPAASLQLNVEYELPLAELIEAAQEFLPVSGDADALNTYTAKKCFLGIRGQ